MKTGLNINPIIKRELRKNIVFILITVVLFIAYSYILPRQLQLFLEKRTYQNNLKNDISNMQIKLSLIKTLEPEKLDQDIKLFSTLLPDEEDYYSIISTLNNLSKISGLTIEKYTLDFQNKGKNTKVTVEFAGDSDKLKTFFENYFTSSGRLITIDSFDYVPNFKNKSIILNFYRMPKKKQISSYNKESIEKAIKLSEEIFAKSYVHDLKDFSVTNNEQVVPIIGEKENPFAED